MKDSLEASLNSVMNQELFNSVKADLPNFPDEVIEAWIGGHRSVWPPEIVTNLGPVFLFKSLEFWQQTEWELQNMDILNTDLSSSEEAIMAIWGGFSFDPENPTSIFEDIRSDRNKNILSYIIEHGSTPSHISILNDLGDYVIADGHHRIYALRVALSINKKLKEKSDDYVEEFDRLLRDKWGVNSRTELLDNHQVWIATHQ